jgi:putative two-component system response regulator
MHDIGKIGIPDSILRKPGPLTVEEFGAMKQHTVIGGRILDGSDVPLIRLARSIAIHHHEKWDGSGYPFGIAGTDIPECGRIVGIVDVYDALAHDRVYRAALPEKEVINIMRQGRGTHLDPKIFDAFMGLLPRMRKIREEAGNQGNSGDFDRSTPDGIGTSGRNGLRAGLAM